MTMTLKHYGKDIKDFNIGEEVLFLGDQTMYMLFGVVTDKDTSPKVMNEVLDKIESIISDRNKVVFELLGLDISDNTEIEIMNVVENSVYGWRRFLDDMRENKRVVKEIERCMVLN